MGSKVKNITFSLPIELIDKLKNYASEKYIPSLNVGVKEALEEYSVKIEKEKYKNEMIEASQDEDFIKDMYECMKAFEASDEELFRGIKN